VAVDHLSRMQVCTLRQTDNQASTRPLSFFTGRMPFLLPNQQRQSTEGSLSLLRICLCHLDLLALLSAEMFGSVGMRVHGAWRVISASSNEWLTLLACVSFVADDFFKHPFLLPASDESKSPSA